MVAAAARLDMQAAQAERMGRRMLEHVAEGGRGGGAVAGELRRLRAQELGQRLVAEMLARLGGEAARGARVARADRHHAARQRRIALLAPARLGGERDQRGNAEDEPDDRPGERDDDRQADDDAQGRPSARRRIRRRPAVSATSPGFSASQLSPKAARASRREKQQQANHGHSASTPGPAHFPSAPGVNNPRAPPLNPSPAASRPSASARNAGERRRRALARRGGLDPIRAGGARGLGQFGEGVERAGEVALRQRRADRRDVRIRVVAPGRRADPANAHQRAHMIEKPIPAARRRRRGGGGDAAARSVPSARQSRPRSARRIRRRA